MPDFFTLTLFKTPLWKFGLFATGTVIIAFIAYWLTRFAIYLIHAVFGHKNPELKPMLRKIIAPISLLLTLALIGVYADTLNFPPRVEKYLANTAHIIVILLGTWVLWDIIEVACDRLDFYLQSKRNLRATSFMILIKRGAKLLLAALCIIMILDNLGINVTSMMVGLGVGGLAVALAGKQILENLFGGVVLILDRPVAVGDSCKFNGNEGIIEEIGMRSVKVRCLDRALMTIPNAAFAEMPLENISRKDKYRLQSVLNLRRETSPDQLRYVLAQLRKLIFSHQRLYKTPSRVRFIAFGSSSLDIEIVAFAKTIETEEFLMIKEDIFLQAMDIIKEAGTDLAFPSQSVYHEQRSALDVEQAKKAEQTVQSWRENNECPIPQFSERAYQELKNTLPFPPKGSAAKPWVNLDFDE